MASSLISSSVKSALFESGILYISFTLADSSEDTSTYQDKEMARIAWGTPVNSEASENQGHLSFWTKNENGDMEEHLHLNGYGGIGIGMTGSNSGITIKERHTLGSTSDFTKAFVTASFKIVDGVNMSNFLAMDANEITNHGHNLYLGSVGDSADTGNIYFRAHTSTLTTRMFISSSGNIGINNNNAITVYPPYLSEG